MSFSNTIITFDSFHYVLKSVLLHFVEKVMLMNYYEVKLNTESHVWKKYVVVCEDLDSPSLDYGISHQISSRKIVLNVLNFGGEKIMKQEDILKKKLPNFSRIIGNKIVIKKDVVSEDISDLKGISLLPTEIIGEFSSSYCLLYFSNVLDCIDISLLDHQNTSDIPTIIKKADIPPNIDGFYVPMWCDSSNSNRLVSIVSERLKDRLQSLNTASELLIFTKVFTS